MKRGISLVCLLAALSTLQGLRAQTSAAQITGRISDPSDAVISNASVRIVNMETGVTRSAITTESGYFTAPSLDPGRYRLEVQVPGFRPVTRTNIVLQVDQVARIDFKLELGSATESVLVQAQAPILDAATSSLGQVVENRQVTELPTNGRNTLAFLQITAGIRMQAQAGVNENTISVQGRGNFSANGGLSNANAVLVDGAPVNVGRGNIVAYIPPVDATQEFKVETNNYSAEYGRSSGGVINLSIKSGTNGLHGSLYEFFRNRELDGNNFFQNQAGLGRPALSFNQYGASVGAPIRKDRTFFFANFEAFNQRQGISFTSTVPTVRQRAGDFSQTFTAAGQLITVADPATTRLGPDGKTYVRDLFPGNVIPASAQDIAGRKFTDFYWPLPNQPGAPFTGVNNNTTSESQPVNAYQGVARVDHVLNNQWKLFGTYAQQYIYRGPVDLYHNLTAPSISQYTESQTDQNAVLAATAVLNPRMILELRSGFVRFGHHRYPPGYPWDLTKIGFPASLQDQLQFKGFPTTTVAGVQGNSAVGGSVILSSSNNWNENGSLTWIHNNHTFKFGGTYRVQQANDINANASPTFAFTGQFTSTNPLAASTTSGVGLASLLLGYPASGSLPYTLPLAQERWYANLFVQDDWKVSRRLTLNLGLQYSLDSSISERFNRVAWFDPTAVPPVSSTLKLPLVGGLVFGDSSHRSPEDLFYKQWAPRIGFAYQLTSKTVIRSGYGIFWLPNNLSTGSTGARSPAWQTTTQFVASLDGGIHPQDKLSNPFPNGILLPPGSANGLNSLIGQSISVYRRSTHTGYAQQWNFDIQQETWKNIVLDVAYAGSKSTGLPIDIELDQLPNQYLSQGSALAQQVTNPFFGLVSSGTLAQPTVARGQLLRPYPQFTSVLAQGTNAGSATYHALQVKATKRFGASVILAAYTASKALGNSEAPNSVSQDAQPGGGLLTNNYNLRQDRSLALFDAAQRFVLSYTVDLPFGKNQKYRNGGVLGRIAGGWQLSGIYTAQSGTPVALTASVNSMQSAYVTFARPNNNGQSAELSGDPHTRLNQWFNTSTFSNPAAFTYGTASRTLPDVRNHGINNIDAGFFKNNRFGHDGRFNLQFRGELFNLFNHVRFDNPGLVYGTAQFGVISAQVNTPRQIQLALKLLF